jgi:Holliday junction resolvase
MVFKNKAKGTRCENELYDLFIQAGFRCIRTAGSGTKAESNADLLAGKSGEGKYAIEVKSSKTTSKYISKEQIENFVVFCEIFGLTPVVALRFNREGWFFINPSQLKDSGKNWAISLEDAKKEGKRFSQFFHSPNPTVLEQNLALY